MRLKQTKRRKYAREWWSKNKERYKSVRAKWYQKNKSKLRKYRANRLTIWRRKNIKHWRKYMHCWRHTNIDARRKISTRAAEKPRARWLRSQRVAKKRGLSWTIGLKRFTSLLSKECNYCGGALPRQSAALDRINNKHGYSVKNTVPCCKMCNWMKSNLTLDEFIKHITKIYRKTVKQK